jgi:hypothetical protein
MMLEIALCILALAAAVWLAPDFMGSVWRVTKVAVTVVIVIVILTMIRGHSTNPGAQVQYKIEDRR